MTENINEDLWKRQEKEEENKINTIHIKNSNN